ncbi:MAG: methyl-accepting chemotaxis protein, partial [Magnetococcales bacterium]|nr:methyl-accepting chemotaxis protein [Magnetococcales bacterium]
MKSSASLSVVAAFIGRMSLQKRIAMILVLAILSLLVTSMLLLHSKKGGMLEDRQTRTRQLVETAHDVLKFYHAKQSTGEMTQAQAQDAAKAMIRTFSYGEITHDYFWINDMTPKMVMHPNKPDQEGKDVAGVKDHHGKAYFQEFVELVKKQDAGFVSYAWTNPKDPGTSVPKISYVMGFKPWGWIVGTGIYIDDVDNAFQSDLIHLLEEIIIILVVLLALSFTIAKTILHQVGGDIHLVEDTVQRLADGDMTIRIRSKKGDPTGIANAVNRLADRLEKIMRIINLHSGGITACVAELIKIRDQIADDAQSSQRIVEGVSEKNNILSQE